MSPNDMAKLEEFLSPTRIVVVATLARSGMPHLTPNWYVFSDGKLHISTTKERLKYINLARDNRMAVCIYSGTTAPEYVTMTGPVEISDDDSIWPTTRAIVKRHLPADRVEGRMATLRTENRVLISLTPENIMFREMSVATKTT
jgi:PPOX class probable F420-dependent enzyme